MTSVVHLPQAGDLGLCYPAPDKVTQSLMLLACAKLGVRENERGHSLAEDT